MQSQVGLPRPDAENEEEDRIRREGEVREEVTKEVEEEERANKVQG